MAALGGDGATTEYVVEVACGTRFTLARTDGGDLYAWGRRDGLGLPEGCAAPHRVDVGAVVAAAGGTSGAAASSGAGLAASGGRCVSVFARGWEAALVID